MVTTMSNRATNPQLSALKVADPDAWRTKVRAALKAEGSIPGAAIALQVDRTTLFRWVREEPALKEGIELPEKPGPRKKV